MGAIGCHGNQSSDLICPKTLCSLSPTPMMLQIKFDQDLQTGLRYSSLKVWTDYDDNGRTADHWHISTADGKPKVLSF